MSQEQVSDSKVYDFQSLSQSQQCGWDFILLPNVLVPLCYNETASTVY